MRLIASRRWCADSIEKIAGIPGDMIVNGEADPTAGIEEAIDPHAMLDADLQVGDAVPEARDPKMQSNMDKQMRITMKDLETYGYTPGCTRCSDLQKKKHRTNKHHSVECRTRMYLCYEENHDPKFQAIRHLIEPNKSEETHIEKDELPVPSHEPAAAQSSDTPCENSRETKPNIKDADDDDYLDWAYDWYAWYL